MAPLVAAMALGGPAVGGWVAAIGTTETARTPRANPLVRDAGQSRGRRPPPSCRRRRPTAIVAIASPSRRRASWSTSLRRSSRRDRLLRSQHRDRWRRARAPDRSVRSRLSSSVTPGTRPSTTSRLAPLGWLMARRLHRSSGGRRCSSRCRCTRPGWRPSGSSRCATCSRRRSARWPRRWTSATRTRRKHSQRVKEIAVDIGRVMRVSDAELEALEWGGLLHDVGKIGVPDDVLLKQERLTREERMIMNAHPVLGAEIIAPVTKLAPELPIIRHHHEWYNGSGYPDRLIGDEIPKLARILHVADAFEAMTAARPYRMTPLTHRAGARRAAQVRRRPVRSGRRRRLRPDAPGSKASRTPAARPSRDRSRCSPRRPPSAWPPARADASIATDRSHRRRPTSADRCAATGTRQPPRHASWRRDAARPRTRC